MRNNLLRKISVLGAGTLLVFTCQSATLADYRVVGGITQNNGGSFSTLDSYDRTGFLDVGGQVNFDEAFGEPNPSFHAQADSEAGYGFLRAHAFSQVIKNATSASGSTFNQTATGTAYATFTDIVVSGPGSPTSVPVSINLHLSGGHTVFSSETPGDSTSSSSSVQVGILFNDTNVGGGDHSIQSIDGDVQTPNDSGMLAGFDGNDVITSPTFFAPVNTPFSIRLQLTAFAGVSAHFTESFHIAANSDFTNTLSFVTSGDVFNLPDNTYTVNSTQAFIEDNNFVPEPAMATAAILTLLGIIPRRRHAWGHGGTPTRGAA